MQLGEQHTSNRPHALVCDQCFRYLGPLELQLGFRFLQGHVIDDVEDKEASGALSDDVDPLDDTSAQQNASCLGSPLKTLKRTALAMLRRNVRVPDVAWEPQDSCGSSCTGGYIPLHLQQLLEESQGQDCSQSTPELPGKQQQPLLGRAVLLPDESDYLFCSHDCAGVNLRNAAVLQQS